MKLGVLIDELGNYVGDYLAGMAIPEGYEVVAPPPDGLYSPKHDRTTGEWESNPPVKSVDERRAEVTAKWDPLIAAKREKIRQLQDEDKAAVAITNAKTDLKKAVTDRNLELGAIV